MSIIPPWEKIVETKKCAISGETFHVTDKDLEFYDSVSPIFNGQKYSIPTPTLCPDERYKRRLAIRNERALYNRKCSLSWKSMISIYPGDQVIPIYNQKEWWSDTWNFRETWQSFDSSISFLHQTNELRMHAPRIAITNSWSENSEYTNQCEYNKNCYMLTSSLRSENCYFWHWMRWSKDVFDSYLVYKSEKCYECINIETCSNSRYLINCSYCHFSQNLMDCSDCSFCTDCTGLNWKKYYVRNTYVGKEAYEKEVRSSSRASTPIPVKAFIWKNNSTSLGDYMYETEDSLSVYNARWSESVKFWYDFWNAKNCYDLTETTDTEHCLEFHWSAYWSNNLFSSLCWNSNRVILSDLCFGLNDWMGCIWINKKASHCILNKPYSKHEYETLCGKIIDHMRSTGEWWEFFPHEMSPF